MGQEFFINSEELEDKVRQLLPSQGGAGAGFDLSASTQIIPIVDLTESAEGSNLRTDLQTAFDFATAFTEVKNASDVSLITTTGFFKINLNIAGNTGFCSIRINDGASGVNIRKFDFGSETNTISDSFIVYLRAGDTLQGNSSASTVTMNVLSRQIASINGELTNPLGF